MNYEDKFNEVERQLIELPHSSDAILSRALRGEVFSATGGALAAIHRSYADDLFVFSEPFAIPDGVRRVAFPKEAGGTDVVRYRYRAGRSIVTISQTRHVLAAAIRGYRAKDEESSLALVTRAAKDIFAPEVHIDFVELGAERTVPAFGSQRDDPRPFTSMIRGDWQAYLCWWARPDEIGFITLKMRGGPQGKGFVSTGPFANRDWFRRLENPPRGTGLRR